MSKLTKRETDPDYIKASLVKRTIYTYKLSYYFMGGGRGLKLLNKHIKNTDNFEVFFYF